MIAVSDADGRNTARVFARAVAPAKTRLGPAVGEVCALGARARAGVAARLAEGDPIQARAFACSATPARARALAQLAECRAGPVCGRRWPEKVQTRPERDGQDELDELDELDEDEDEKENGVQHRCA